MFKTIISRLNEQLDIVDWYVDLSEAGVDTKELVVQFGKLKIDY